MLLVNPIKCSKYFNLKFKSKELFTANTVVYQQYMY